MATKRKYKKGLGFNKYYITKSEQVMAGTYKVRTYNEWEELLNGDLGKQIGIDKF